MILENRIKSKMRKGITIGLPEIMYLVLILGVIVASFLLLNNVGLIKAWILGQMGVLPQSEELEAAIKCAYYRCTEGCTARTKAIVVGEDTPSFNCSEFCEQDKINVVDIDNNEMICGVESKYYPVEAVVSDDSGLTPFDIFRPMMITDSCGPKGYDLEDPVINIEKILTIKNSEESCTGWENLRGGGSAGMIRWATQCDVKNDNYFIYTEHYTTGGAFTKKWQIILCSETPVGNEITIEPDILKETQIPLVCSVSPYSDIYRIIVTNGDEAFLKVEGAGPLFKSLSLQCGGQNYPDVSFTCKEATYLDQTICVSPMAGSTLDCGKFSLTLKTYYLGGLSIPPSCYAVFDIVYKIPHCCYVGQTVSCLKDDNCIISGGTRSTTPCSATTPCPSTTTTTPA